MDGKGRWVDNVFVERLWRSVRYENVYLRAYESMIFLEMLSNVVRPPLCVYSLVQRKTNQDIPWIT